MKKIISAGRLSIIVLVLALAALPGCSKNEQTENNKTVSGNDVNKETSQYNDEQIQAFCEKMDKELTDYGKKIDLLQARVENLKQDAREKADNQLAELRQKYGDVYDKVEDLKNSGSGEWAQLKAGISAAMEKLADAYQRTADAIGKS